MAHIVRDLTYIARCGSHYRNEKLEPLGLTGRQAGSILVICNSPGISQEQLGKRVVLNKSNITRQLTYLEEQGYVNRITSPTDKRVLQLYPTQKALDILPRIRQVYLDWRQYLLKDISQEDQALLESLLERIKEKAYAWMDGGDTP